MYIVCIYITNQDVYHKYTASANEMHRRINRQRDDEVKRREPTEMYSRRVEPILDAFRSI